MPKINPLVINTAPVKVRTNANPTIISIPTEVPTEPVEPGQPNTPESATPEAKPLPPQYEALAKKESALRIREKEFQDKEAALGAKIQEAVNNALEDYKSRLKSDTLDVLNDDVGLTYDQLVEQAVNRPDPSTRALEKKLETLEANQKKQLEDSQKAAEAQRASAINQIRFDVTELIDTDPTYETIKGTGSSEDVVNLITKTFDETGKLLTVEQAAKMVEDELFEEAIKIASLGKVKAKLVPTLTPELVTESKQGNTQKQPTTLTNQMTTKRPMSARDRAIARFKGEKF